MLEIVCGVLFCVVLFDLYEILSVLPSHELEKDVLYKMDATPSLSHVAEGLLLKEEKTRAVANVLPSYPIIQYVSMILFFYIYVCGCVCGVIAGIRFSRCS